MNTPRFGWKADSEDGRDYSFAARKLPTLPALATVPQVVDMISICPIVVDQGDLNACVGNAIAGSLQVRQIQQGKIYYNPADGRTKPYTSYVFAPSRLFIYYGARVLEGTQNEDSGATIRNGFKYTAQFGVSTSAAWPYRKKNVNVQPSVQAYLTAKQRGEMLSYYRIATPDHDTKLVALAQGYTFVFGFWVFSSFLSNQVERTGVVPMPRRHDTLLGGHAAVAVGYDTRSKRFTCRNSWGPNWGNKGYFTIPFDYLNDLALAGDFWVPTEVE